MTPILIRKNNCYHNELQGLTAGFRPAFFIQSHGVFDPLEHFHYFLQLCVSFLRTRVEHRFSLAVQFLFQLQVGAESQFVLCC